MGIFKEQNIPFFRLGLILTYKPLQQANLILYGADY